MRKRKTYPTSMFSYKGLTDSKNIDQILKECPNSAVVRRVIGKEDDFLRDMGDGTYTIPRETAKMMLEDAIDMSMNLYTTKCPIDNYHYLQNKQPACASWKSDIKFKIKDCKKHLRYEKDCFSLVYPISHLHNKPGKYNRIYDKSSRVAYNEQLNYIEKAINAIDKSFSSSTTYQLSYQLKITHKPVNANYWHATLDIEAPSGSNLILRNKSKWCSNGNMSLLAQVWLNYLIQGFEVNKTSCEAIDASLFIDDKEHTITRLLCKTLTCIKAMHITL